MTATYMKSHFLQLSLWSVLFAIICCISSCSLLQEVEKGTNAIIKNRHVVEASTQAIRANEIAVQQSTHVISQNQQIIKSDNQIIKENSVLIDATNQAISANKEIITRSTEAITANVAAVERSSRVIQQNVATIEEMNKLLGFLHADNSFGKIIMFCLLFFVFLIPIFILILLWQIRTELRMQRQR